MKKKVTQQDIANALKLSRNTVSKVFSNHTSITSKTRQMVLDKAREMGYLTIEAVMQQAEQPESRGAIALLCHATALSHAFWAKFIPGLEASVSQAGYLFSIHIIAPEDEQSLRMPNNWQTKDVRGIALAGVFQPGYVRMLQAMGLPLVMFDSVHDFMPPRMIADIVMMENTAGILEITRDLIRKGHRRIGFIGDITDAASIYERWLGFYLACTEAGFQPDPSYSLLHPCPGHYYSYTEIHTGIASMTDLPTAFVCAADDIAIYLMRALGTRGLKVPQDIAVSGFDNFEEAYAFNSELTSVNCFTSHLGQRVGEALVRRINHPQAPLEIIRQNVAVHLRESTHLVLQPDS